MKCAVVVFPGSNCDVDCYHALTDVMGMDAEYVWHQSSDLSGFDAVVLPGGFTYGDYLRPGALARFSPVMEAVKRFAAAGGPVLGICNGFQILCEAGLLPGALIRNEGLKFRCRPVHLRVERVSTPFTRALKPGQVIRLPIAHGEGNYRVDPETLRAMEARGQIVLRYCDPQGRLTAEANPNGSVGHIAAVCNEAGNVMGMMPHPERYVEGVLGGEDGRLLFESLRLHLAGELLRQRT